MWNADESRFGHDFKPVPGGCFLVNGCWVDANGKPTKSPDERKAEAEAAAQAEADEKAKASPAKG